MLRQSCRHVHNLYPNWVCDLTSGLDTRMVLTAMVEPGVGVNVVVNGDDDHLDVVVAHEIAKHFGWPLIRGRRNDPDWPKKQWSYFEKAVALSDGQLLGNRADATISGKERLSRQFSASLGGGMAELYRDFLWQQEFFKIGKTTHVDLQRLFRYRFFFNARPEMSLFHDDWRPDHLRDQERLAQEYVDLAPNALNTVKLDLVFLWKMTANFALYTALACPVIQTALPSSTSDLAEAATSLPYKYRVGNDLCRHIITRAHPELAKFRTWYGGTAEPIRITRPRHYLSYQATQFQKLVRKFGQLTIKKPIFKDPLRSSVPAEGNR